MLILYLLTNLIRSFKAPDAFSKIFGMSQAHFNSEVKTLRLVYFGVL